MWIYFLVVGIGSVGYYFLIRNHTADGIPHLPDSGFCLERSSQFVFCISEVSGECAYRDRRIDACRMGAFCMDRISDLMHCKESM